MSVQLAGSYMVTDTFAGPARGLAFFVSAQGDDENEARALLFERIIDVVAPVLAPLPTASALPGYRASALIYLTNPRHATLRDMPVHRMAWAFPEQSTDEQRRTRSRQIATRFVRECRIDGALPYTFVPPDHALPCTHAGLGLRFPTDPNAVLMLGTAQACRKVIVP